MGISDNLHHLEIKTSQGIDSESETLWSIFNLEADDQENKPNDAFFPKVL